VLEEQEKNRAAAAGLEDRITAVLAKTFAVRDREKRQRELEEAETRREQEELELRRQESNREAAAAERKADLEKAAAERQAIFDAAEDRRKEDEARRKKISWVVGLTITVLTSLGASGLWTMYQQGREERAHVVEILAAQKKEQQALMQERAADRAFHSPVEPRTGNK
jgi:hypothetical protein